MINDSKSQILKKTRRRGERGPDKVQRKRRVYPLTVKMQLKLPIEVAQWVRNESEGQNSKFITTILTEKMNSSNENS